MNIFYLHKNPYKAAQYQYNKHVVKMILESAQMLCTAHHCYGDAEQKSNVPYKQAHLNTHQQYGLDNQGRHTCGYIII